MQLDAFFHCTDVHIAADRDMIQHHIFGIIDNRKIFPIIAAGFCSVRIVVVYRRHALEHRRQHGRRLAFINAPRRPRHIAVGINLDTAGIGNIIAP